MNVTRPQEAELESLWVECIAEVTDRKHVLHRRARPEVKRRLKRITHLARIEPVRRNETRQRLPTGLVGVHVILSCVYSTSSALVFIDSRVETAFVEQLTRPPTTGQVVVGRFGARQRSLATDNDFSPIGKLFGASVARINFNKALPLGVVTGQLFAPVRTGGCVYPPCGAMRNYHRRHIPLVELGEQGFGGFDAFATVRGQVAHWNVVWARRDTQHLAEHAIEIQATLTVQCCKADSL